MAFIIMCITTHVALYVIIEIFEGRSENYVKLLLNDNEMDDGVQAFIFLGRIFVPLLGSIGLLNFTILGVSQGAPYRGGYAWAQFGLFISSIILFYQYYNLMCLFIYKEREQNKKLAQERSAKALNLMKEVRVDLHNSGCKNLLQKFASKYMFPTTDDLQKLNLLLDSKGVCMSVELLKGIVDIERKELRYNTFKQTIMNKNPKIPLEYARVFCENYDCALDYDCASAKVDSLLFLMKENDVSCSRGILKSLFETVKNEEKIRKEKQDLSKFERELSPHSYSVSINEIDEMNGYEFEEFLFKLYSNMGYKCKVTSGSGDQGADLIIEKNGLKSVVQAKRYESTVGNKAVQETIAARLFYKADKGIVVTNNFFTPSAKSLAKSARIELVNREYLISLIEEYPVSFQSNVRLPTISDDNTYDDNNALDFIVFEEFDGRE